LNIKRCGPLSNNGELKVVNAANVNNKPMQLEEPPTLTKKKSAPPAQNNGESKIKKNPGPIDPR